MFCYDIYFTYTDLIYESMKKWNNVNTLKYDSFLNVLH